MDRKSVKRNLVDLAGLDFDYTLTGYTEEEKEYVKSIKSRLKAKLLPRIKIFKDFKILFGQLENKEWLGLYINGSSYWKPTFVIDLDNIIRYANEFDINEVMIIETTILHELGHAIQEKMNIESNENEAENFANDYFDYGIINKFWLKEAVV